MLQGSKSTSRFQNNWYYSTWTHFYVVYSTVHTQMYILLSVCEIQERGSKKLYDCVVAPFVTTLLCDFLVLLLKCTWAFTCRSANSNMFSRALAHIRSNARIGNGSSMSTPTCHSKYSKEHTLGNLENLVLKEIHKESLVNGFRTTELRLWDLETIRGRTVFLKDGN